MKLTISVYILTPCVRLFTVLSIGTPASCPPGGGQWLSAVPLGHSSVRQQANSV